MVLLLLTPNTHTTLFWHPYDVVLTLWTLYGHRNDVVYLLGGFKNPGFIFLFIYLSSLKTLLLLKVTAIINVRLVLETWFVFKTVIFKWKNFFFSSWTGFLRTIVKVNTWRVGYKTSSFGWNKDWCLGWNSFLKILVSLYFLTKILEWRMNYSLTPVERYSRIRREPEVGKLDWHGNFTFYMGF